MLFGDGQHLIDTCDKQDSPVIEDELSKLRGRWEFLVKFAKDRSQNLEDAMIQARRKSIYTCTYLLYISFLAWSVQGYGWGTSRLAR